MNRSVPAIALLALAWASGVCAGPIVQIEYAFQPSFSLGGFPSGVSVTGTATFDLAATDNSGSLTLGNYDLLSHTVSFNGSNHTPATNVDGQTFHFLEVHDDAPFAPPGPFDSYRAFSSFNFVISGITIKSVGFRILGPVSTFSGDGLFVPDPTDFSVEHKGIITFENPSTGDAFGFGTDLTQLQFSFVSVPEPGLLSLLGFGEAALLLWRGRRAGTRVRRT